MTDTLTAPDLNAPFTSVQAQAMARQQASKLQEFGVPDEGAKLAGAAFTSGLSDKSYQHMYWKRPDGYIVVAPGWPVEFVMRIEWGWEPLSRRYGKFFLTTVEDDGRGNITSVWQVSQDQFRQILARDGAREFCLAQIIENNWHRKPPRGVVFPQLAGATLPGDFKCSQCGRIFNEEGHLRKHESIMHRDEAQNNQLARSMNEGSKATMTAMTDAVSTLASSQAGQAAFNEAILKRLERGDEILQTVLQRGQTQDLMIAKLFERLMGEDKVETMTDAEVADDVARQATRGRGR